MESPDVKEEKTSIRTGTLDETGYFALVFTALREAPPSEVSVVLTVESKCNDVVHPRADRLSGSSNPRVGETTCLGVTGSVLHTTPVLCGPSKPKPTMTPIVSNRTDYVKFFIVRLLPGTLVEGPLCQRFESGRTFWNVHDGETRGRGVEGV